MIVDDLNAQLCYLLLFCFVSMNKEGKGENVISIIVSSSFNFYLQFKNI